MANVCSDNIFFFSDDNPDGIKALWSDLEASITPGYHDNLGDIKRLFSKKGISADALSLNGTITDMTQTDGGILLELDTAWRPLYDAYQVLADAYHLFFVMESTETGCGIFYSTDDTGILFKSRYCVTGDTEIVTPCGRKLYERVDYGETFSSEAELLARFRKLGFRQKSLTALTDTLEKCGVYIHSFFNPYQ